MKLSARVILIAGLSLVVLATVLTVISIGELRRTSERHLEAYLTLGLEYYMQEYPQRLHGLLERNGLAGVESFVGSYQTDAIAAASDVDLRMDAEIVVVDVATRTKLSMDTAESHGTEYGGQIAAHVYEHVQAGNLAEGAIHFDQSTRTYYVFSVFDAWGWIVVATAPDRVVRSDLRSVTRRTVITTVGIVICVAIVFSLVLRRFFVSPILRIAAVARALPLGLSTPLEETNRTDELGTLAHDIATAGATIEHTQGQLRETNQNLERTVRERTAQLEETLQRQKTLVREVHHRVKNNMAVVGALLDLERSNASDPQTASVMSNIQSRVASMTMIHDQLYRGDGTLSHVDSTVYLDALVRHLSRSLAVTENSIVIDSQIESVPLSLEVAMPCGLITNELVSNASKYAFPGKRSGTITVRFGRAGDQRLRLSVSDDGVGLVAAGAAGGQESSGVGSQLVAALVGQLDGQLTTVSEKGHAVTVTFPYSNDLDTQ